VDDWAPGDIVAETNSSFLARLIQLGQWLWGNRNWRQNHILIVVNAQGGTIEAQAAGVVRSTVGTRKLTKLRFPDGVERDKVVAYAEYRLGTPYDYWDDVALGIDCVFRTHFRDTDSKKLICSELGALALSAGGWRHHLPTWQYKPGDLADELGIAAKGSTAA
jgi:hypothetical protein